ncbi:GNAT family N-acetyltransferase [Flavobacterium hiemivividum]|uniref:N-acetyltransferase n=1 Tax=Flavobacterium hiemivividum TaxID=2541734 RepID=A0A4R5D214_9FLAO|nr:GNAT family N-acetyltransferase [Flavobacterium hiemivividum]TDE05491.1 N-acetyltransferase [Flavobacterium hiemivividum]
MLTINFSPFPNLETERLSLRRVNKNDASAILELRSSPESMKYIPRPLLKTTEDALEHIAMIDDKIDNNEGINWAITLKNDSELIGLIGFYRIRPEHYRAEIGYMLLPDFSGKGIISEAVNELMNYGFKTMQLHSVEGVIDPNNLASEKVLQKNGFIKEAHLRENEYFEGRFWDSVIYSKLNQL